MRIIPASCSPDAAALFVSRTSWVFVHKPLNSTPRSREEDAAYLKRDDARDSHQDFVIRMTFG
ncbi:hypothetical protein JOB18_028208 [Solea senegalensis]|uniref:Uncharacterized protein n=1 Tax=Solea senegalensis TaxID=28829 RepID=A0AAV6T897_SOLSE|nr:hypothetical protein JOB18_028208 [Solea senegalensis]